MLNPQLRLKQEGIQALAAFLNCSRQLVVLLSPRYLSRLWCVFEISTFLQDRASINKIQIMPLKTTVLLLMVAGCWHMLASYYFSLIRHQVIGEHWRGGAASGLTLTFAMFGFCSVILPLSFYVGIGHLGFVWEVRCFRRAKYMCMCVYIYICISPWGTTLPWTCVFLLVTGAFHKRCGPKVRNFHEFQKMQSKLEKMCLEVREIPNSKNSGFQKFKFSRTAKNCV